MDSNMSKKQISIIDYLHVLVKWRKAIFINSFIICFITAAISLIVPKWFTASTTILPPIGESAGFDLSSLVGNLPVGGLGMGFGAESGETFRFTAILNSRTVMQKVAKEFDLVNKYKAKNMEETVKTLRARVTVEINDEGTITLSARAKTPYFANEQEDNEAKELAKDMTNTFIEILDKVNKRLKNERAHNTRILLEKRYQQNLESLEKAEEEFKQFQEKYGTIALPEQTTATITAAAELKAKIIAKEVQVGMLSKYVGKSHAEYIRAQNELQELNDKYNEFTYGKEQKTLTGIDSVVLQEVFVPLGKVPDMGLQYFRLFREVKLQEKLLEFLLPQYEQAKLQEARDTPTVQVLDRAVKPERKSKPKRMLMVLFAGLVSLIFSLIAVYIAGNMQYLKETDYNRYEQIQQIYSQLKPRNWLK